MYACMHPFLGLMVCLVRARQSEPKGGCRCVTSSVPLGLVLTLESLVFPTSLTGCKIMTHFFGSLSSQAKAHVSLTICQVSPPEGMSFTLLFQTALHLMPGGEMPECITSNPTSKPKIHSQGICRGLRRGGSS